METETATKPLPTKTFHQVHEELESEALFLQKEHDVSNFKNKSNFLKECGFNNSIATKLYEAVADNQHVVAQYARKYKGQYKFILKPQLERVCEKYNLYVRATQFFMGDIPEKNIKDIMNFSVYLDDLDLERIGKDSRSVTHASIQREWECEGYTRDKSGFVKERIIKYYPSQIRREDAPDTMGYHDYRYAQIKVPVNNLAHIGFGHCLWIGAIKPLFSEDAFNPANGGNNRIPGPAELGAKGQVNLDPIVLCETKHGYIIITAWGDEANDELIVNQNNN